MRNGIRKVLAALTIPAAIGLAVAVSVPALADTTGSLCEAFGAQLCAGGDQSSGSLVLEKNPPGRTITWHPTSGNWQGWPIGNLKEGSLCFHRAFQGLNVVVELGDCGATGTAFWKDNSGSHLRFGNKVDSEAEGHNRYLSGVGSVNSWFIFGDAGQGSLLQQFTLF
jgi:hypothetical protein